MCEAVAQVLEREDQRSHPDRVTTRHGCRNVGELIQRATRVSGRTASDVIGTARAVRRPLALSTGEVLPAEFPRIREALGAGEVGMDGVVGVVGAFRGCMTGRAGLLAADDELAAAACGEGADAAPRPRPTSCGRSRRCGRRTSIRTVRSRPRLGRCANGGSRWGAAATTGWSRCGAAFCRKSPRSSSSASTASSTRESTRWRGRASPRRSRTTGDEPVDAAADDRSHPQKQHDALAVLLTAAAASGALPTLGGAAPTLVVSVREEDLATGRGYAHLPGDHEPISLTAARHIACTGDRATGRDRRERPDRVDRDPRPCLQPPQRRAITVRDGGCLIPGCHVPPQWCEIHHVEEHSRGGPTHTDNGVLLCWFHHRTIDSGGWRIRMVDGIPHVAAALVGRQAKWRPATKSPTRRRDTITQRT